MVDIKFFKPVSATFSGTAGEVGSFPPPSAPGAPVSATLTTIGTGYATIINNDGTLEVELVADDTAATATPTGMFIAAIHRTTLPTYTDGDGGIFHLDSRGRLLVSSGETGLTVDVETDQDPAPATPIGSFVVAKYEGTLPTYTVGDASTLHADARGRLLTASIDLTTGASADISTEDSAGPTNPVGSFGLGLYRSTLPTYTDGDAACFHFTSGGLLRVSSSPSLPATSATSSVAGAAASTSLLASNTSRLGATFFNEQPTDGTGETLFLLLDAAVASATNYTVQVPINSYYEVPFGYTGEVRGIWGAAVGDVRVTELT
jgi:hypothetical protein